MGWPSSSITNSCVHDRSQRTQAGATQPFTHPQRRFGLGRTPLITRDAKRAQPAPGTNSTDRLSGRLRRTRGTGGGANGVSVIAATSRASPSMPMQSPRWA